MKDITIFPAGVSKSCRYAAQYLERSGYNLTDHITPEITHVLLDIPSLDSSGRLMDSSSLSELLHKLPEHVIIIGGNLHLDRLSHYPRIDLLADPLYLAKNAAITAECAVKFASGHLDTVWSETPALILGWGRIGKCLASFLKSLGCSVTVAARSCGDRAMLQALGFVALDYSGIPDNSGNFRILFNTVPYQTVDAGILSREKDLIKIDLASAPGLVCDNIITARGLPGKYAPASAGKLIAQSVARFIKEDSV